VLCDLWCGRLPAEVELVEHDVRAGVPDNDAAMQWQIQDFNIGYF
jgi:hypothetical protein